jgi:hypothetical protein
MFEQWGAFPTARENRFKCFLPPLPLVRIASNAFCLTFEQWTPLPIAREIRFKRFLRVGFKAEPYPEV